MRFEIRPETLQYIAGTHSSQIITTQLAHLLPDVLVEYRIHNKLRVAHFLAQLAWESDHFRTFKEYASGRAYEGRRDLGNVKKGDGVRFKGRGPIQITGRYNYRKYGELLGYDLENHPELAEQPEIGLRIAAEYWKQNRLNQLADQDNGKQITRKINGGYNGLAQRLEMVHRAKKALDRLTPHDDPKHDEPVVVAEAPVVEAPAPVETPVDVTTVTDIPVPTPPPVDEAPVAEPVSSPIPQTYYVLK